MSHATTADQATSSYREDIATRPAGAKGRSRKKLLRWGLMAGGVLAVVIGGGFYWLSGGRWVDTDDAYVQADSMTLSTDVSGIVAAIPVHEGQMVTAGAGPVQSRPAEIPDRAWTMRAPIWRRCG